MIITVNDELTEFRSLPNGETFVDQLISEGHIVQVRYDDGAFWEFGPNGHSIKLNSL